MKNNFIYILLFILVGCAHSDKSVEAPVAELLPPEVNVENPFTLSEEREIAQSKPDEQPVMWEMLKREEYRVWSEKEKRYIYKEKIVEKQESFDKRLPENKKWTIWVGKVLTNTAAAGLITREPPSDIKNFCPKYSYLDKAQKIKFWTQLVAALTYRESNWNPRTRYPEKSLGIDPVTKKYVYSEGLMQLSYQDVNNYKEYFNCEFNYKMDLNYEVTDLRRTILNPYNNLRCGILILNHLVKEHNKIALNSPYWYWSVLSTQNAKYIQRRTQSLNFCK